MLNKPNFDPKKTIFLIDGSTFLYRAYYSMRPLHTSKGIAVQAVYNFIRMIKKLMNNFDPHCMVLTWDSKGKTERHEVYHEYKAGRQEPPSDLFTQKKLIVDFANLIGLAQAEMPGVEADDIINSLTQDYKKRGFKVIVVASDKDLYQLIDKNVYVYDPFKEEITDQEAFKQKMSFSNDKLAFYYAILGDVSDNIPGVKGIGKTGATDLVNQFSSLEDLYNNLDQVKKDRVRNLLAENKEKAFLSLKLFLPIYYEIPLAEEKINFESNNWANARSLFEELEFKSLLKEIGQEIKEVVAPAEEKPFFGDEKNYDFKSVITEQGLNELIDYLKTKKVFAVDTETDGLNPAINEMVGISICAQKGLAFYIPIAHKVSSESKGEQEEMFLPNTNTTSEKAQLPKSLIIEKLKPILEDSTYKKILHNTAFDKEVFYYSGINLDGVIFDTMLAASLIIEDWQRLGLKYLSEHYLNERMLSFEEMVKNKNLKDFSYVPIELATKYAAGDAHQTFALHVIFEQKLKEMNLKKVFETIEMPTAQVIFKMEAEGIIIDTQILKKISIELDENIKKIETDIQLLGGITTPVNLNSPKQVEDLLFNKLKLPTQKKSSKGTGYSTDQKVLEELSLLSPVPALILKYREMFKLKSTYVDALPGYIDPKTNRIHTTFSQVRTATGRLSSYEPNLQNIPTDGYGIRKAFIPEEGHVFLSADYSQIELRVLAFLSQDQNLVNAFLKGEDIHRTTASYLFDVSVDKVTNEQRQIGKRINFSIMYGLTPFGLSKDLKIPFKDAKIYIDKYFAQYPQVSSWMEKIITGAKEKGYVETYFGRRRFVPGIYEKNRNLFELARRIAINTPAQGTAAEIMKLGMVNLSKAFEDRKLDAKIILQIHDELLISVPKGKEKEVEKITKNILESVIMMNVPLLVSTRFGNNWQEVTK